MKKSIIQPEEQRRCYICGSVRALERHHVFGAYNRRKSEKYGLTVLLCHNCHNEPPTGAHHCKQTMDYLHWVGQQAFEAAYPDKDFISIFGRNYL